jgi:hypothetical protein
VFSFLDGLVRFYKPDGSWRRNTNGTYLDIAGFPADIATQVGQTQLFSPLQLLCYVIAAVPDVFWLAEQ